MKTTVKILTRILLVLVIISATIKLFSMEYFKMHETTFSILRDITDVHASQLNAEQVVEQLDLSQHKHYAFTFRFINLSDVSMNQITQFSLKSSPVMLSNEIARDREVKELESTILSHLTKTGKDSLGRSHSSIYLPIAKELITLSNSGSDSKVLVVYSDLMENTEQLSFYEEQIKTMLQSDPKKVKGTFESIQPLPNLMGVQVYFVYQPNSQNADVLYKRISTVYRDLLTEKGAQVYIQPNFIKMK